MALYRNTSNQLEAIKEKPFKLEKEIQRLFENNLIAIMGLTLVLLYHFEKEIVC